MTLPPDVQALRAAPFNLAAHVLAAGATRPDHNAMQIIRPTGAERWSYGRLIAAIRGTGTRLLAQGQPVASWRGRWAMPRARISPATFFPTRTTRIARIFSIILRIPRTFRRCTSARRTAFGISFSFVMESRLDFQW